MEHGAVQLARFDQEARLLVALEDADGRPLAGVGRARFGVVALLGLALAPALHRFLLAAELAATPLAAALPGVRGEVHLFHRAFSFLQEGLRVGRRRRLELLLLVPI